MIRAVVFDVDGTLLDTLADIGNAMNAALAQHGFPGHSPEAYRGFIGRGLEQLVATALPEPARGQKDAVVATFRQVYAENLAVETKLYPGIAALLDALAKRELPLAILSNKPDGSTRQLAHTLLGRWRFADVRGERPGVPRKPSPQAALDLSRGLGVPPGDCLFVGDSGVDMETAKGAGMVPVGVLWGFRGREELLTSGARHLLTTPEELLPLLQTV